MDDHLRDDLALRRSEEKFRLLFERSPVGMAMVDYVTGDFLEVNSAFLNPTGYQWEELAGLSFWDITPEEYRAQEIEQLRDLREHGRFGPNEKEYIRKDGSRYPIKISGFLLTDVDGRDVIWGLVEDISVQKAFERDMLRLALYDPLTELPNRRLLSERIEHAINFADRNGERFALMLIDLDNFKPVNDTYGHAVGDSLLKAIALRLTNLDHRKTDTIARIGGDEFVVLLTQMHSFADMEIFAERILRRMSEPYSVEGSLVEVSVSIGIAVYPDHASDELSLMRNADAALYRVKNALKNGYGVFQQEPQAR